MILSWPVQILWPKKGAFENANDLKEQAFYRFIAKTYWGHIALQFALLYAIGGWPWFVWLGCIRVSHHHMLRQVLCTFWIFRYQCWHSLDEYASWGTGCYACT